VIYLWFDHTARRFGTSAAGVPLEMESPAEGA